MKWNPGYTWSFSTALMSALMAILLIWPEAENGTLIANGPVTNPNNEIEIIPVPDKDRTTTPEDPNEETHKKPETNSPPNNDGGVPENGNGAEKNQGNIGENGDDNTGRIGEGGFGFGTNRDGSVFYPPNGTYDKAFGQAVDPSGRRGHFLTLNTQTIEVEKGQSFDVRLKTKDNILINSLKSAVFKNSEPNGAKFDVAVTGKGKDFNIHVMTKTGGKLSLELADGTRLDTASGKTYKIGKFTHFGNPVEVWEPITLTTKVDKMTVQPGEKVVYDIGVKPRPETFDLDQDNFRNNRNTPVTFSGLKPTETGWQMEAAATEPGKIQLAWNQPFVGRSAEGVKLKTKGPFVDKKAVDVQSARFEIKGKMLLVIADTQFFRSNRGRFTSLMTLAKGDFHPDPIYLLKADGKLVPWDGTVPMGGNPWSPEDLAKCWTTLPQTLKAQTKTPEVGSFLLWPESSNQDNTTIAADSPQDSKRLLGLIGNPNRVSEELAKQLPVGNLLDLRTDWKAMVGSIELQIAR